MKKQASEPIAAGHKHKIVKILRLAQLATMNLYLIEMDCPVQPMKAILYMGVLSEGQELDPHFTNMSVVARFPPGSFALWALIFKQLERI